MWSRLTEYAAEIVAPPSEDGDQEGDARVGDELWSRFTNIVAPTRTEDDAAAENERNHDDDEDDQERYISELERALLQKKKQNEQLEARIRELETLGPQASDGGSREDQVTAVAANREKDDRIARLESELEALKQAAAANSIQRKEMEAEKDTARVEQVAAQQKRVAELEVQCGVLDATLRDERAARGTSVSDQGDRDTDSPSSPSIYPTLVQAVLTLSNSVPPADGKSLQVGATDAAVAAQLLELSESLRQRVELSETRLTKVHAALSSFFEMQNMEISRDEGFDGEVQGKLGVVSHRLSKGESGAREIVKMQQQLQALTERDEKNQKTISALQTQLSGVQASKRKNDASLANREVELLAEVEKREKTISNLQASEDQLKHTLEELGKELEDAHTEADEVEKVCQAQQRELKKLQRKSEQANELEAVHKELQTRVLELEKSAQEYEQGYLELLQEAEAVKKQTEEEKAQLVATTEAHVTSAEQQMLYELQARLSACEADKLVAVQDADRLQSELDALDSVLLQFRADHKQQRERLLHLEQQLEDARRGSRSTADSSNGSGAISEDDFRRVMEVLSKRTLECDQLREALESAAKRYSANEVLDKRLAAQLVVSYLESDKKDEVLLLMSRMMAFTEEQMYRAGIRSDGQVVIPGNGGGGLFSSIFTIPSGGSQGHDAASESRDTAAASDPQGKNINELWTNFLLDEAKR